MDFETSTGRHTHGVEHKGDDTVFSMRQNLEVIVWGVRMGVEHDDQRSAPAVRCPECPEGPLSTERGMRTYTSYIRQDPGLIGTYGQFRCLQRCKKGIQQTC